MKPTVKHFVSLSLPYAFLLTAIFSITSFANPSFPILYYFDSTTVKWAFSFFIIIVFFFSSKYFYDNQNRKNMISVNLYLFWTILCIIRGVFEAQGYWEWKAFINNAMGLLLPIIAYSATNKIVLRSLLSFYVKYALPLFLILIFLVQTDAYGFYLMPVSFLLLFLPALSVRKRVLLLIFTAIVLTADLGARSNVIKFSIPLLLLIIYFKREIITPKVLEFARLTLIIAPLVFFTLAVTGVFNIFNMSEYLGEHTVTGTDTEGKRVEQNIATDTRSFIYVEVLESAMKNNYWVFGRTPARGNDSEAFGDVEAVLTGRYERSGNEVGIANVFTWLGVIGVIFYLFVFYRASYLAVNRSNNIYAKMLGIYIAFRWLYSWVEDVNNFSLNYFMLWIMIGMCFSYSFRVMTNYEVTLWVRSVFDHRYLNFDEYLKREENEE